MSLTVQSVGEMSLVFVVWYGELIGEIKELLIFFLSQGIRVNLQPL